MQRKTHTVHVGSTFARRLAALVRFGVGFAAEIVPVPSIAECARVIGWHNFDDRPVATAQPRRADRFIVLSRGRFPDVAGGGDSRISPLHVRLNALVALVAGS